MSKDIPYSDYFDEYTVDNWSYSSFIRYAFSKRLLPSDPVKVYNFKYRKCLDFIEQNYDPLKRSKAISLKASFKCLRATLGFLGVLLELCSIKPSIDTRRGVCVPPWVSSLTKKWKWLANLSELAKNEETAEHEYHTSLNKDVRKEKMIYSRYLLESRKSKHQIDRKEEATSTKRITDIFIIIYDEVKRKDLTNVSLEDDGKSNTNNVTYSGKSMDDLLPDDQAYSKKPLMESNHSDSLCSSSSAPSSNINCEDIEPEYYDAR
ncbi:8873_t:CDS:2 [Acaulospora morrowiae]|uniref:8873_t:CDS:1 n=1 Tax=Acaulospora morrowiae TaxID=94023 RepID=A0A9N9FKN4_9GLOM|nr:8873_t:CDS:2 [Acaulospora morrowiae]